MGNSLNTQTYENLKRDIMTLALMPGEPVSAAKIAERYNVSRTPAREAIVKLESEALIDIYPQSGSVISRIDVNRAEQ
ncbi:MAG: GntR family transcriptional regulator, partial [Lachnospiraceae bacterium]|nr:GntR family transcriptional regulator [Lachnospiraceae bacterium]